MPQSEHNRYIIEYRVVGTSVRVTAFDPETLTEAVVVGATSAGKEQLAQLAIRKLHYILNKPKTD